MKDNGTLDQIMNTNTFLNDLSQITHDDIITYMCLRGDDTFYTELVNGLFEQI